MEKDRTGPQVVSRLILVTGEALEDWVVAVGVLIFKMGARTSQASTGW